MALPTPREIIIKNGTLIDGSGTSRVQKDVRIKDDTIREIGDFKNRNADLVIDATGKFVVPGFIDVQSHTDAYWTLFTIPNQDSLVNQGITSLVMGTCGSSIAPLPEADAIKSIQKWADISEVQLNWLKLSELYQVLEDRGVPLNVGTMIGHSTVRRGLLREEVRDMTTEEMDMFRKMVDDGMADGAFGVSFGLAYSHANFVGLPELVEIGRMVANNEGYCSFHLRYDDERFDEGVAEVIEVGKQAKVPVMISHLRANGSDAWPRLEPAINLIDEADKKGVKINFNMYPYDVTLSVLYNYLPPWFSHGGKKKLLERIKNKKLRDRVTEEMRQQPYSYADMIIARAPFNPALAGKKIGDMAVGSGLSAEETVLNSLLAANGQIIILGKTIKEEHVKKLLSHRLSMLGTDAAGYDLNFSGELVHPRSFGTFPRVIAKYVRDDKLLTLEAAIQKMTATPAAQMGMKKRGLLRPDYFADVVVFDPATIQDEATTEQPFRYPTGIEHVMINGKMVQGPFKQANPMAGYILRHGRV